MALGFCVYNIPSICSGLPLVRDAAVKTRRGMAKDPDAKEFGKVSYNVNFQGGEVQDTRKLLNMMYFPVSWHQ